MQHWTKLIANFCFAASVRQLINSVNAIVVVLSNYVLSKIVLLIERIHEKGKQQVDYSNLPNKIKE